MYFIFLFYFRATNKPCFVEKGIYSGATWRFLKAIGAKASGNVVVS